MGNQQVEQIHYDARDLYVPVVYCYILLVHSCYAEQQLLLSIARMYT
jgi:hypothetical protein